jgi:hypothetical protein
LDAEKLRQIEEHRRQAEALLPETAEAHFLRAMTAITVKEQLLTRRCSRCFSLWARRWPHILCLPKIRPVAGRRAWR